MTEDPKAGIKTDVFATASPIVSSISALFLSGSIFFAGIVSFGTKGQLVFKAGLISFGFLQLFALMLGIFGVARVKRLTGSKGLPEAFLGIGAACLFSITAGVLLAPCAVSF